MDGDIGKELSEELLRLKNEYDKGELVCNLFGRRLKIHKLEFAIKYRVYMKC